MAHIIFGSLVVFLQIITILLLLRNRRHQDPGQGPEKKWASQPLTPKGIFAVESKRIKTTVNDDSALYERELER